MPNRWSSSRSFVRASALLLACCVEPLGVGGQARLVGGNSLALPLAELVELLLQLALAPVEVGRPGHQPLLEPFLHGRDRLRELDACAFGLALDRVAPFLGQAPLLLAQLVAGVRALAREHPLELRIRWRASSSAKARTSSRAASVSCSICCMRRRPRLSARSPASATAAAPSPPAARSSASTSVYESDQIDAERDGCGRCGERRARSST